MTKVTVCVCKREYKTEHGFVNHYSECPVIEFLHGCMGTQTKGNRG